ncbi:MAG: hypothetical protein GF401_04925 [Chitinivibrionales bacterium]|nr:hypothetical protein [Chitinivibrionales bacterium]
MNLLQEAFRSLIKWKSQGKLFAPLLLFVLLLTVNCDIEIVNSDPLPSPYRTEHFIIHYSDQVFTPVVIEQVGMLKEDLLRHVNTYLSTNYDGTIEVFITDSFYSRSAKANTVEQITEKASYTLGDDGHEIAHIVSIQQWGLSTSRFIEEGIAEAASVYNDGNAFTFYANWLKLHSSDTKLFDSLKYEIEKDITESDLYFSYAKYSRAGAFLHYLVERYGVSNVKRWYQSTVIHSNESARDDTISIHKEYFEDVFEVALDQAIDKFFNALKNETSY